MITERHKQAVLDEVDETIAVATRALRKRPIAAAYDKLRREERRFGSGGNFARSNLDGMPRAKGYDSSAPRSDDVTRELDACDRRFVSGLRMMQAGAATVNAAAADVDRLTGPAEIGNEFWCVGLGEKNYGAHWAPRDKLTDRAARLCKTCDNRRRYLDRRAEDAREHVDSEVAA